MSWMIVLGISSGLCWGTADFFGGLQARRYPALTVALWSQIVGGAVLLLVTLASGQPLIAGSVAWGMISGIFGGFGLLLFYRGLATGLMSLVAPISACGAIVPVVADMLRGVFPSPLASVGMLVAIGGVILVSLQPPATAQQTTSHRVTVGLSLGAALAFGLFFVFIDQGTAVSSDAALWVIVGARLSSLALLSTMSLFQFRAANVPRQHIVPIGLIGIADTTANALFAYASTRGSLGEAAVLGSLYPVATVLLSRVVLGERLHWAQGAGVLLALSGIALLSAG